jgi:D-aminopeptidase
LKDPPLCIDLTHEFGSAQPINKADTVRNLITDVPGLLVGNAEDQKLASGVTAILFDEPAVASVDVRGGAPGTRETDLLAPEQTVERIDAIVLSGGSAFGLDAPGGVQAALREQGRGFAIGSIRVPMVPGAILFDLLNGGDKNWGRFPPYRDLGYAAAMDAGEDFALGSAGAGLGATTVNLKGGLGSASATTRSGTTVGAIVAVNAVGSVTVGDGPMFWAAAFERDREFGGRGWPTPVPDGALTLRMKGGPRENTTIALVATDATLTKPQAKRLATMAHDGMARAIYPAHTPIDGDIVFAAATGKRPAPDPIYGLAELGATAANVLARACARAVYEATALPFANALPSWKDKFGR